MKNIYLFALIFMLGGLSACHDLDPKVFDKIGSGNYPQTEEDVKTMVTGVYGIFNEGAYSGFGDIAWQSRWVLNTATTDEFICFWGGSVWDTYRYFQWISSSEHVTAGKTYDKPVKTITNSINTIEMMKPVIMNEDLKKRYTAELKGIIALYSYYLYTFYGPVPLVLDPEITMNPNTDFIPERPTREWMVEHIKKYAREAIVDLPLKYDKKDYGRITKGTALMALLKLAMHEKDWQGAVDVSKEIMDLGIYDLENNYLSIFSVENEMNDEIIWAVPCAVSSDNRHNNWLAHVLPSIYEEPNGIAVQKWGGYKVPWDMYDKFWDKVGAPGSPNDDQRLQSLWGSVHIGNGNYMNLRESSETWAQMGAIPYKYPADPGSTGEAHGNDWVVFRYADVLLLRAEALNKLTPLSTEAIGLINEIRDRANTTLISASDFSSGDELNAFILDERFRELFMEGHRREDMIRHGTYLDEAQGRGANHFNESRLLFPLPQWVIDQSEGKVSQNTGY